MKNLNIFSERSYLHPFRWFIMSALALILGLGFTDATGYRLFAGGNQQQWAADGPGYHK